MLHNYPPQEPPSQKTIKEILAVLTAQINELKIKTLTICHVIEFKTCTLFGPVVHHQCVMCFEAPKEANYVFELGSLFVSPHCIEPLSCGWRW